MKKILLVAILSIFSSIKPANGFDINRESLFFSKLAVAGVLAAGMNDIATYLPTTTILLLGLATSLYSLTEDSFLAPDIQFHANLLVQHDPQRIQLLEKLQNTQAILSKIRYLSIVLIAYLWVHLLIFDAQPINKIALLTFFYGLLSNIFNHLGKKEIQDLLQKIHANQEEIEDGGEAGLLLDEWQEDDEAFQAFQAWQAEQQAEERKGG